jgi:hypothetical protein
MSISLGVFQGLYSKDVFQRLYFKGVFQRCISSGGVFQVAVYFVYYYFKFHDDLARASIKVILTPTASLKLYGCIFNLTTASKSQISFNKHGRALTL